MFKDWILALDFDGVVWNSVDECFVTGKATYQNLFGVDCSHLQDAIRAGRWLVRGGGDFYVVFKLAVENPNRDWEHFSKTEFVRLKEAEPDKVKAFEQEFYRVREEAQTQHPEEWAASQRPYKQFVEQFPAFKAAFREIVLTTTKDQHSAETLLATAGIKLSIWGREHGTHKGDQINDLCKQRSITADKIVFIDDLLDNLEHVAPTGAHGFLASWGYNTPEEQTAARAAGFGVLELEGILPQLEAAFQQ